MGFTKQGAVTESIKISVGFQHRDLKTGRIENVDVLHVLTFPGTVAREGWNRDSVQFKGRKARTAVSEANWNLWRRIVEGVEGYDDLPQPMEQTREELISYFSDDVGRLHVDEVIDRLWEEIRGQDAEWEKKSEPSSEGSLKETRTEIRALATK